MGLVVAVSFGWLDQPANGIAEMPVGSEPRRKGLSGLTVADDQHATCGRALQRAVQNVPPLGVAPAGERENVESAGAGYRSARNFPIVRRKYKQDQQRGGEAYRLGDDEGLFRGGQLFRRAIEMLALACQNDK